MSRNNDSLGDILLKALAKGVATLIAMLIILGIRACSTFIINGQDSDLFMDKNATYAISGIDCNGDQIPYRVAYLDESYNKNGNIATIRVWKAYGQNATDIQDVKVQEYTDFNLPACKGQDHFVAYLWSAGDLLYFRIHPEHDRIYKVEDPIPQLP